ncbi:MAG TPA: hypothetical protein VJ608_00295 [Albitalea sp.]|nr:hypothetical protein [Albitalea sp.]
MRSVAVLLLAIVFALAGCTSSKFVELVQMPQRDADIFPWAQKQAGVAVAVDEIDDLVRANQYFGVDLPEAGLLPVNIIVSNHGQHRVTIKPADILLLKGRTIIDPLPSERVVAMVKTRMGRLRPETKHEVEGYFRGLALRETTLAPNESYQGVLFFPVPQPAAKPDRFFTELSLFLEGTWRMHVAMTDLDTRERLQFGPFALAAAPRQRDSFPTSSWTNF